VPGPWAVAIHVIDGLGVDEAQPTVGSIGDDNTDPAPKQNGAVIGAAVYRATKQSYVLASSAQSGLAGTTLTYSVPGASAARHVVFDAPEQSDGQSTVTAAAVGDRCLITIIAGAGLAGHPLMFSVGTAASGCTVSEDTNVPPGTEPPGGGVVPVGNDGGNGGATGGGDGGVVVDGSGEVKSGGSSGCGCALGGASYPPSGLLVLALLLPLVSVPRLMAGRRRQRQPEARSNR
jgi:hypothetical protein